MVRRSVGVRARSLGREELALPGPRLADVHRGPFLLVFGVVQLQGFHQVHALGDVADG